MSRIASAASCLAALTVFIVACSKPSTSPGPGASTNPDPSKTAIAAATRPAIDLPPLDADKPVDYPGIHNAVRYGGDLVSGAAPEGDVAFETLAAMGVKTIISVDGAVPDVEAAKAHGLRYVHLPIGYNGMDHERTLEIAKAVKELPGPIYLHCHHGKHRSAGAAGAAAVTLGFLTPDQATERMRVSGTAANYTGLFKCVAVATVASVAELSETGCDFPEVWKTSGLVQSMVETDEVFDHLKAIEKAGWKAPADHPDLVPVAEAGRLADIFRNLKDDDRVKAKPAEFTQWLLAASGAATALEDGLAAGDVTAQQLSERFKPVAASCKDCHAKYRD